MFQTNLGIAESVGNGHDKVGDQDFNLAFMTRSAFNRLCAT